MIFSLEQTVVTLNNFTVTGWSDDSDALSLPQDVEIAQTKFGADGLMTGAGTGTKGGAVIFKLLANSPTTKILTNLATAFQNGARLEFNGTIEDAANGISILLERGVLTKFPLGPSMGKGEVSNAEFEISFERIMPDYSAAKF